MLRILSAVPKLTVTALIILAIVNLLVGVILRYFVGAITDWLDLDPVPFTWVEEVGELSLAWLTLIGAAIGIASRSHFSLSVFVHRLPESAQLWIHRFNHALIDGALRGRRFRLEFSSRSGNLELCRYRREAELHVGANRLSGIEMNTSDIK